MTDDRGGTKMPVRAVISKRLDDKIRVWAAERGLNRSDSIAFLLSRGLELDPYAGIPDNMALGTAKMIAQWKENRDA
jgi:hypothetical protein